MKSKMQNYSSKFKSSAETVLEAIIAVAVYRSIICIQVKNGYGKLA